MTTGNEVFLTSEDKFISFVGFSQLDCFLHRAASEITVQKGEAVKRVEVGGYLFLGLVFDSAVVCGMQHRGVLFAVFPDGFSVVSVSDEIFEFKCLHSRSVLFTYKVCGF